ncbi:hypothetical protein ONS95_009582 [Cadophora gregata]|uniref:uncharacterized protein n=1 Tax=Cadophora gregata TaxID=51156 RepID=UPI0026DD1660|nr:uncharacterized protein ONS95_009582 [Cadophora gregata]KAK0124635.1 hypothetical protein ONS95_009582 [Cadophora gregata]KAK0129508.1 hypothetical protein ONS96_000074 [Cadophora gregata f. sp. sojae]
MTKDVGDCAAIKKSACQQQQQQPKKRRRIRLFKQDLEPIDGRLIRNPPPKAVAPYTARSELEDASLRFLIHHYVTVIVERTVTCVGPRWEWYPLAVRDPAFFNALISSTSSHAAYLQQVDLPRNFFYHRGEAIRLLNERIRQGAHDEGTINCVALFSQQESLEGRPETALTHINGLLTIVSALGGPHSPRISPQTRRHIYLSDLVACISLDSKPLIEPALDLSGLESIFGRPSAATGSYTKTFGNRLYNFTGSSLSDLAGTVLWGLRNVSERLEGIHAGTEMLDTLRPTDIQFTDRVEALERLVHGLWYVEDPENPQHPIFRTFGWASLIYIYTILRELPKELGVNTMLANRIKLALEACPDLNVLLATFQDLLLWQMFLCGRVADSRDRPFFAQQATKILIVRKTENSDEILAASKEFLWPERIVEITEDESEESGVSYSSDEAMKNGLA